MGALKASAGRVNEVGGIKLVTTTVKMCCARCTCREAGRLTRGSREMEKQRDGRAQGSVSSE